MPQKDHTDSKQSDLAMLVKLITAHAPYDGRFELRVPGVYAIRLSHPSDMPLAARMRPAVCITAQGEKRVLLGEEVIDYTPSSVTLYCVDVPISAEITKATPAEPFLNLRIDLDPKKVATLAAKVYQYGLPRLEDPRAVHVGPADSKLLEAATRLLDAMADPSKLSCSAPRLSRRSSCACSARRWESALRRWVTRIRSCNAFPMRCRGSPRTSPSP